jgi:protein subunit release factor B
MIDSEATVLEIRADGDPRILIPFEEIRISYTRSGGPGGQHVNKTSTQAELTFDLAHSSSRTARLETRFLGNLAYKFAGISQSASE